MTLKQPVYLIRKTGWLSLCFLVIRIQDLERFIVSGGLLFWFTFYLQSFGLGGTKSQSFFVCEGLCHLEILQQDLIIICSFLVSMFICKYICRLGWGDSGVVDSDFSCKLRMFMCYPKKYLSVFRNVNYEDLTPHAKQFLI